MNGIIAHKESGQTIIIVALVMVALVALLLVVVDGGYGYFTRRAAQNAADAGALAGANVLCNQSQYPGMNPNTVAINYAVARNGAGSATSIVNDQTITVTAEIPYTTSFGTLFGFNHVPVKAVASAGCYAPCTSVNVLPVAWACSPPVIGEVTSDTCGIDFGNENSKYIIMDSSKIEDDFHCKAPINCGEGSPWEPICTTPPDPNAYLDCDLDNDGYEDILGGGQRSWLDLNGGGGGAAEMKDWIANGYSGPINTHYWFGGQSGDIASIYMEINDTREGQDVILPMFNAFCFGLPDITPGCVWHDEDTIILGGGSQLLYYHIFSFSVFHITCVDPKQSPSYPCPMRQLVIDRFGLNKNSLNSIEGYFIQKYDPSFHGACGECEQGACTIHLSQ